MRITKAKFENFAGFFTGMNLKTLELDFEAHQSGSPITMIFGKNRSGKTCLISMLQPFPGSNDTRKNIIIDGEDGRKVIEYCREDGERFKTEIVYLRQVKSEDKCFFFKFESATQTWVNLNPSGKIRSYEACVEEHLHLTKDYFTVGRIGGISNIVDLSRSDRKRYIANFLPDIDPYLQIHKISSEKFTGLKKTIATFTDELTKLSPADICASGLVSATAHLKSLQADLAAVQTEYGSAKGVIDHILENTDDTVPALREFARTGKNTAAAEVTELELKLDRMRQALPQDFEESAYTAKVEADRAKLNSLSESLAALTSEFALAKSHKSSIEDSLAGLESELQALGNKEAELNSQSAEVAKLKADVEESRAELKDKFTSKRYERFSNYTQRELEVLKRNVSDITAKMDEIRSACREFGLQGFNFFDREAINIELFSIASYLRSFRDLQEKVESAKQQLSGLREQTKLEEILDKRPAACKLDTCPFISMAVGAAGSRAELSRLEEFLESDEVRNLQTHQDEIEAKQAKQKFLESFGTIFADFQEFGRKLISLRLLSRITEVIDSPERFVEIVNGTEAEFREAFKISDIVEYVNLHETYRDQQRLLKSAEDLLSSLSDVSGFISGIQAKQAAAQAKLTEAAAVLESAESRYTDAVSAKSALTSAVESSELALKAYSRIKTEQLALESKRTEVAKMEKFMQDITANRQTMLDATAKLNDLKGEIRSIEAQRDSWNFQIEKRKELESSLETISSEYGVVETVKSCTDTVKGIPVFLIDSYLEDIRIRANQLLDLTFNGSFQIDKFVINEKEFSIPVRKGDGSRLDDVLEGSGAEISFIKEALSFAIIEKAIKGYNIISLDEVDGVLDEANRTGFLRMLKRQIEDLHIEQIFIISHQRSFLSEAMDMVLLKDHGIDTENSDLMANKSVIFDYSN